MIQLPESINAWGTPEFNDVLKGEVEQLGVEPLPLQQGLSASNYALNNKITVMIINVSELSGLIRVKAGIFYSGIIAGCSCADDPTPVGENSEYCEVQIDINKETAEATVTLLME
ncbi:MAG: hypothetical protein L0Z73_10460 [Gammaproteobacteria bacterium]|nr:hypothetical protein [Gammaproteobacteria bacterium]